MKDETSYFSVHQLIINLADDLMHFQNIHGKVPHGEPL